MMINAKCKVQNYKFIIIPLLLLSVAVFGCQRVEKPSRDGTGPMAIVIEVDEAPESHMANTTAEGEKLETRYAKMPIVGKLFRSSLKGLDYWKAHHPYLLSGTTNPVLLADPDEACLDCHDQNTSCNNCHQYVGVKLVKGEEE
jgi:hypothetical protein